MNLESIRIALSGIFANKLRSALTTLGILIGVGSVIVLVAVGILTPAGATIRNLLGGVNTQLQSAMQPGANNGGQSVPPSP